MLPDLQVPMSRMEPGEDLRQRYAAMEDRLKVRLSVRHQFAASLLLTADQTIPSLAAAGGPEACQQAHDFGREGEFFCFHHKLALRMSAQHAGRP